MNGLNARVTANVKTQPATTEATDGSSLRLDGWKEIANYLGRSTRCAQRWERNLQLPVHRIRHTDGSTVYAYAEELELWRVSRDEMPVSAATEGPAETESVQPQHELLVPPARWNRSVFDLCRLVLRAVPARSARS